MPDIRIEPRRREDAAWAADLLSRSWGSTRVVSRGRLHDASVLPGFVAFDGSARVGLATYTIESTACELVTLNSLRQEAGVGSALLAAVFEAARRARCTRVWCITTNDNTAALRFYQKRGWRIVALHADAIGRSRELKPEIPLIGLDDIPIRDELELELQLK
jgi:ribosomal protein S18 acetylase RimI-like enzyme